MNYLIHDADGKITSYGGCPDDTPESAFAHIDGTVMMNSPPGVGFESHYVDGSEVKPYPEKPSPRHVFDYAAKAWVLPASALADAKKDKCEALRKACRRAIIAGFTSDALGSEHTYPSDETDQANLSSSVLASMLPGNPGNWATPFLCADAAGNWDYRAHTAVQIQKVGVDGKAAILAKLTAKAELFKTVMQAQSIEAVEAVAWV